MKSLLYQNYNLQTSDDNNTDNYIKKLNRVYETIMNTLFYQKYAVEIPTQILQKRHQPNHTINQRYSINEELIDDSDLITTRNYDSFISFLRNKENNDINK